MEYVFLIIALFTGIVKVIAVKNSGRLCPGEYNSVRINFLRAVICVLVSLITFFAAGSPALGEHWWIWLASGVFNALLMFVWILCTQRAGLVFVETFGLVGSVAVPLVLAPFLYSGESVTLLQWVGVGCLFAAVALLALDKGGAAKKSQKTVEQAELTQTAPQEELSKKTNKAKSAGLITAVYIVLYVISNAGISITPKLYREYTGGGYETFFNLMTFAVVLACFSIVLACGKIFKNKSVLPEKSLSSKKTAIYILIAAVMMYSYQFFMSLASALPSAVLYPLLRGGSILLTVLCDAVIYKQKITSVTCLGVAFAVIAIVLTSI